MSAPSIFVSYAHADADALKQLKKHFAPLEREGLARLWADEAIDFGDDWDDEIAAALDGCRYVVPVLSADFFASTYIAGTEIPRLLERQAKGEIEVLPIFWSPCSEPAFPQTQPNGEILQRRLSDWQGLGRPGETLKEMGYSERARAMAKFAEALRRKLGKATPAPAVTVSSSTATRAEGRVAVTAELRRDGGQLQVSFRRPGERPFASRKLDWATFEPKVQGWNDVLDNFKRPKLEAWIATASEPGAAGQQMLELLLGDATSSRPILDELFRHKNANYPWRPVDLRIVSNEPSLARLPWRLLAHNGRFLIDDGWTMALGREVEPSAHVQIDSQRDVLIAAAGDDAGLAETLAAFLRERWEIPKDDGRLRISRSAKDLRWAFGAMNPQMVILAGECSGDHLLFSDGKLALAELAALEKIDVLVVACAPVRADAFGSLGKVLLFPRLEEKGPLFAERFVFLFENLLVDELAPPPALHGLLAGRKEPLPDVMTWFLWADYASWSLLRSSKAPSKTARLLLDRTDQKNAVGGWCWDLAQPESPHKVLAVLAHADRDAAVDHHAEQLFDSIVTRYGQQLQIQKERLDISPYLPGIAGQLDQAIRQQFGPANCTLEQALRQFRPKARLGRNHPVVFLDCGTYPTAGGVFGLRQIHEWISFADGPLRAACPADLRILLYLGLEVEAADLESCNSELDELREDKVTDPGCHLRILPELHIVPLRDLREYLKDKTRCPADDAKEAARLIHAKTKGKFDPTVEMIDRGERIGWHLHLFELKNEVNHASKP